MTDTNTSNASQALNAGTAGAPPAAVAESTAAGDRAAATETGKFYDNFKDADLRTWVANKNYGDIETAFKSSRDLEKLVGNRDKLIQIPMDDNPESWKSVYDKLGRPPTPADYKITVPENGGSKEFADKAANWFHTAGLNQRQAEALTNQWNEFQTAQTEASKAAQLEAFTREETALKNEWGAKYDAQMQSARTAAKAIGVTADQLDVLEKSTGYSTVMKLFSSLYDDYNIGREGGLAGGRGGSSSGANSAEQAKAEIERLKFDSEFSGKIQKGDPGAIKRWNDLHRQAAGASA